MIWTDDLQCAIIDPGCYDKSEQLELTSFIQSKNLVPKLLLNTHCHLDHVVGNAFVKATYQVPLLIPEFELEVLRSAKLYAPMFGFATYQESEPDGWISKKDPLLLGSEEITVLSVPGHSPDHVAFVHAASKTCISGDVLFYESIGRTDLPGGNHQTLINSIQHVLFNLANDYSVYSGHGKPTTIGHEKKYNPHLR